MLFSYPLKNLKIFIKPLAYLLMILLGIACGLSSSSTFQSIGIFVSDAFIKIFKFISLPVISLSLIVTMSSYRSDASTKKIWRLTLFYTLGTTLIAASISCLLYWIIQPSRVQITALSEPLTAYTNQNYLTHILNILPTSLFSPFLEHQVMAVLLISVVIGIAIRYIPELESKQTIIHFFQGAHSLFIVITKWIIAIIPIALFGFITVTVMQLKEGFDFKGIGEYLGIIVLANIVQGLIILPLWLKINKIPVLQTIKGASPALSLAFFTKSSAGTLPVTMEVAEQKLNISPKVSRFVLPLCTSINMNGCAAFIFATVIFLMQNNGIEITASTMIAWIFIATIAAIGNAGVPMGCFFLSASLLASMNVPIVLLGLILPFYSLIDMLETSLNVWSDMCVAKVVNENCET